MSAKRAKLLRGRLVRAAKSGVSGDVNASRVVASRGTRHRSEPDTRWSTSSAAKRLDDEAAERREVVREAKSLLAKLDQDIKRLPLGI